MIPVLTVYFAGRPTPAEVVQGLDGHVLDRDGVALNDFQREQILGGNYRIDQIEIVETVAGRGG